MDHYPIVHTQHFAAATRDTGYRSTTAAVAELVDNAVQASARDVRVLVSQSGVGKRRRIRVAVSDNGTGMDADVLQLALQFGGSTRFNDRGGMGRFGMGLPNSSVSQARRVDVYTWRSQDEVLRSYLDLDEIAVGAMTAVPRPAAARLPRWAPVLGPSGTLVVWSKTDRLDYRKAGTIASKLQAELGRLFRHVIWAGVSISVNGEQIGAVDPLFLNGTGEAGLATQVGEPLTYEMKVPGRARRTALITVRFARLPVERWAPLPIEEKRARGIIGGGGVSVVRASREIAHGWYFLAGKRRQNYDDWWRAEVCFDPLLDELFGVSHSKQGVRPTSGLQDVLARDMERVARRLSTNVRAAFALTGQMVAGPGARRATDRDWRLPRLTVTASEPVKVAHVRYTIETCDLPSGDFCRWDMNDDQLVMKLNTDHAFYRKVYARVQEGDTEWLRRDLECLLLAFGRAAEMTDPAAGRALCAAWSDALATFVGE